MEETASLARSCPACGAAMPQQARFCGACGADAQASPERQPSASEPAEVPAAPLASSPDAASEAPNAVGAAEPMVATPVAPVADGRACLWCGAINPKGAARCATCDAVFPTPEGDAALERAAQERISEMEKQLRQRGGWWPFRSR
ncbi:MAG TPA: zinc ribbon domain-containing protein [Ktedonobacterales bacterium]